MTIAVTGATGFVGGRLLDAAAAKGVPVRALTRRDQPARDGVTWIDGSLEDPFSLARLCENADSVIHVAGVLTAPDAASFELGNVLGTIAMLEAAHSANVRRFVHVSSLSAREPDLSLYGGSKARAELAVSDAGGDHVIVRPPAIYGPGDRETLELFKMAQRGLILMPPEGRASYIHADDLARLLLALAQGGDHRGAILEPDDGRPGGWPHREFGRILGRAVGKDALTVQLPGTALKCAAAFARLFQGQSAKLTPDRAAYFCHADWSVDPTRRPDPALWQPAIETEDGVAATAAWYRDAGWL